MDHDFDVYLAPTAMIDSDHYKIIDYSEKATKGGASDPVAKAVRLYYAVRDPIWYNPYVPFYRPEHYRASTILEQGRAYCVGKATLLCALGRASGIPSRVGFADVRNHLATKQLLEYLGSNLFVYHGFTEFYLNDTWVKATPAFNIELCKKHHVLPLEFNGLEDSIFQPYNGDQKQFMDYVKDHGSYADIPVGEIVAAWKAEFGDERVLQWIAGFENAEGKSERNFDAEEVVKV